MRIYADSIISGFTRPVVSVSKIIALFINIFKKL